MNNRIKTIRINNKLTQEEFGIKLSITKSSVSLLESGKNKPSEQTIKLICSEFDINEDWLRNGSGNMFCDISREEMAARIVGKTLNTNNEFIINTFIALGQLSEAEWDAVQKFVDAIKSGNRDFKTTDSEN